MRIEKSSQDSGKANEQVVGLVLREAKKLHRAAVSESLAESLPVLRRLLSAQVIQGLSLPELSQGRSKVQRKHVLRALAIEAGYSSWEEYRVALVGLEPHALEQFDVLKRAAGYPNLWFSSFEEAEVHAAAHGGRAIRVGKQAVVLVEAQSAG